MSDPTKGSQDPAAGSLERNPLKWEILNTQSNHSNKNLFQK